MEAFEPLVYEIRKHECERIRKNVNDFVRGSRTSITVTGDRGSGKTALLKWVEGVYFNSELIIPIFINAGVCANPEHFASMVYDGLKRYIALAGLEDKGTTLPGPEAFSRWEGKLVYIIDHIANLGRFLLLIVDDIQNTSSYKEKMLDVLRNIYQVNERLLFIFSIDTEHKNMLSSYDKAFHGSFQYIHLDPLNESQSLMLLQESCNSCDNYALRFIIDKAEGNPLMLRIMSLHAANLCNENNNKNADKASGILKNYLRALIEPQISTQGRAVLKEFAVVNNPTVTLACDRLNLDAGTVINQLNRLIKKGLVNKDARGSYRVKNYIRYMYEDDMLS